MREGEPASDPERTVECSGRSILECKACGERLILLGQEEDWRIEERTEFECSCGKRLALSNRLHEEVLEFRRLLRAAFTGPRG